MESNLEDGQKMPSGVVERGHSKAMTRGRPSHWHEAERDEQGLCGHVKSASIEQEMQIFFFFLREGKTPKPPSGRFWSFTTQTCHQPSKYHSSPSRNDNLVLI